MKILLVSIFILCLVGCTINIEGTKEEVKIKPTDNVTQEIPKWPEDRKQYWVAMYFAQLASNPTVRYRYLPFHTFQLAQCIVNSAEELHPDIEWWEENIGLKQHNLDPIYGKEIYDITYKCSLIQQEIQQKEMMEKSTTGPDLEDAV
jgi:hypothetical protein|tara:strand:- start:69 stop:509 length:441 start_codon:yes stop_codon:yes gene_type:complete